MVGAWFIWLFVIICTVFSALISENGMFILTLVVEIVLPVIAVICNRVFPVNLYLNNDFLPNCEKEQIVEGNIKIVNDSVMSYRKMVAICTFRNLLTGEKSEEKLQSVLYAKEQTEFAIKLKNSHCGVVKISCKDIRLYDFFGLTWRRIALEKEQKITVLPSVFPVSIVLRADESFTHEHDWYAENQTGQDMSEVYDFREYTTGDNMKQIQWKLSEKHDNLIVRRGSKPLEQSVILIMYTESEDSKAISAMAEGTVSVAQSLCEAGVRFILAFQNNGELRNYYIEEEDDLVSVIRPLLSSGNSKENIEIDTLNCAHIVCMTCDMKTADTMSKQGATVLLFGQESNDENVINIITDNVEKELIEIEI